MNVNTHTKDPVAVKEYSHDWTPEMTRYSDEIATSNWVPEDGITVDSATNDTMTATVWLSGGTAGEEYKVANIITTTGGRTDKVTKTIIVMNK